MGKPLEQGAAFSGGLVARGAQRAVWPMSPGMGIAKGSFSILLGRGVSPSRRLCDSNHTIQWHGKEKAKKNPNTASSNFCY